MDLRNAYGYSLSMNGKCRRRCLKSAIQDNNFDRVFESLKDLIVELEGYKSERVRQDLIFLKKRKERYYTEKKDYSIGSEIEIST